MFYLAQIALSEIPHPVAILRSRSSPFSQWSPSKIDVSGPGVPVTRLTQALVSKRILGSGPDLGVPQGVPLVGLCL